MVQNIEDSFTKKQMFLYVNRSKVILKMVCVLARPQNQTSINTAATLSHGLKYT